MKLIDKIAIITGASSGIGRASAYLFAKEGAKIVVADIDHVGGEETVNAIKANGGQAIFVHTDVSIAAEVEHLIKLSVEEFGKIDILYNNAGTGHGQMRVDDIGENLWDHIYAVNVKSIFLTAKYAVPKMREAGGGTIINTASDTGITPQPKLCAYTSSKGAVISLTKSLAAELAPDNIRVNCICPSMTDTPMLVHVPLEFKKRIASNIPLGRRLIKPEEVAYAALFFASDESAMISGIHITVDGGFGISKG